MIFKEGVYSAVAKLMCRYGYVVIMIFWYGAIVFLFLPSIFLAWKELVLSASFFGGFYNSMTSRSIGYYVSISGVVFSVLMYSYAKLNQGSVVIFPNDDMEHGDPKACEVIENRLFPRSIKQEYIFWAWVLKNSFFAIWAPQLVFGFLGYLFS